MASGHSVLSPAVSILGPASSGHHLGARLRVLVTLSVIHCYVMIAALATLSTQVGMGTSWLAAGWAGPRPAAISAKLKVVLITCHKLTNNIWSEHYRPSPAVSPVVLVEAFSTNNDSPVPQYLCPLTVSTLVISVSSVHCAGWVCSDHLRFAYLQM